MLQKNNSKIYLWLIAVLIIANVGILAFFLTQKKPGNSYKKEDRQNMIASFLEKEIGFSEEQVLRYRSMSDNHMKNMKTMFDSLGNSKDRQFKKLTEGNFSDSAIQAEAEKSGNTQEAMEIKMFNHLRNVRSICTPEQLPKFDSLFVKMLKKKKEDRDKQKKK